MEKRSGLAGGASSARWHIENTALYQLAHCWHFTHVFTHGGTALPSLQWGFLVAFNLLQRFIYRQLGGSSQLLAGAASHGRGAE